MARYDIYRDRDLGAFLLDVQNDLLGSLNTRVIVPLLPPKSAPAPAKRLNPIFRIGDQDYVMVTQFISAVPEAQLGEALTNARSRHDEITAALDMLFQGF